MVKVTINYTRCIGNDYKLCVEICSAGIFRNDKSARPEVAGEENCTLCRACQVNCPGQAIEILA